MDLSVYWLMQKSSQVNLESFFVFNILFCNLYSVHIVKLIKLTLMPTKDKIIEQQNAFILKLQARIAQLEKQLELTNKTKKP